MKNPNGYGCIRLMSGSRRRPYAFIATVEGKQHYIAAFESAYEAKYFKLGIMKNIIPITFLLAEKASHFQNYITDGIPSI